MEKVNKTTSCFTVDKYLLSKIKDDEDYKKYIIQELSNNLARNLVDILSSEGEVLVSMSDVRCHDNNDFATVDYRRYLKWSHLVRCKDCKWYKKNYSWNGKEHKVCVIEPYEPVRKEDDFCSYGERKETEDGNS